MISILGFLLLIPFYSVVSASNTPSPKDQIVEINSILPPPLNKALSDFLCVEGNWDSLSDQTKFLKKLVECFGNRKEVKGLLRSYNKAEASDLVKKFFTDLTNPQSFEDSLLTIRCIFVLTKVYQMKNTFPPDLHLSEHDKSFLKKVNPLMVLKIVYQSFQICLYAKGVETFFDDLDLLKSLQSVVPKPPDNKKSATVPHDDDDDSNSDDGNTKTSNTGRNPPPKGWSNTELALIIGGIALLVIGIAFVLKRKRSGSSYV
jgi:hypothetical protein